MPRALSGEQQRPAVHAGSCGRLPLVLAPRVAFTLLAGIFAVVGAPFVARGVRASSIRAFADFPWLLSPAAAMFLVVLGVNLVLQTDGRPEGLRYESRL